MVHERTTIPDLIRAIICDTLADSGVRLSPDDLADNDVLSARGADPLDVMQIVYVMEETFGISVPDDAIDPSATVADVIAAVAPKAEAA